MWHIHFYHLCTVPLICYDRLKTTFVEVKRISSSSQTRTHVTVSVYKKYANYFWVYVCGAHSILRVCMIPKRAAYAYQKTFQCQQKSAEDCLRLFVHGNKQLPWVSDTQTWTLLLVSDRHTQLWRRLLCCKKPAKSISSRTCHCALW